MADKNKISKEKVASLREKTKQKMKTIKPVTK